MLRKLGLLALVGLLTAAATAAPVRVEDAFTIKLKKSKKGDVGDHKKQDVENNAFKIETSDGNVLKESKEKKIITEHYKETILEKEKGKRATKLRREYRKVSVKVGDKETTLPYEGKTVLIEKKGDKYHFTLEGGEELKGKDAEQLNRSFNNKDGKAKDDDEDDSLEKMILPKKPIAVNGTWKIEGKELIQALNKSSPFPFPIDESKAIGKGKLLRAYKKEGRQYGVFEIQMDLPLKGEFSMGKDLSAPIQKGSKMNIQVKLDGCIDGSSGDSTGDMKMDIDMVAQIKTPDGKELKLTVRGGFQTSGVDKDLTEK